MTIGNNGNTAFTDGTLEIWMPQYMVLEQTTIAGLDVTCTTSDVTLPHKLICT
ncbi:MAG: hypothetical protein H6766_05290 [Candidatus Peribacteria bacterium]|nr:MAG: hypothetical protein H6766_05290 [Candidatus Peribacteria bacterium]